MKVQEFNETALGFVWLFAGVLACIALLRVIF